MATKFSSTLSNTGNWLFTNRKAVIALLIFSALVAFILKLFVFKKKGTGAGGGAPDVSNPISDPVTVDRMTSTYNVYKGALPKDELAYKDLANSLQSYMQTHTDFFSSDYFGRYFNDLTTAEFIAMWYFWGAKREYTGSFISNPFGGLDDQYGDMVQALKARAFDADYSKIQSKFQGTGVI